MKKMELLQYLRRQGHISAHASFRIVPLSGGNLNQIYLFQNNSKKNSQNSSASFVLKQGLTKAKIKIPFTLPPERVLMEKKALELIRKRTHSQSIPKIIFFDENKSLLAMEAVAPSFRLLTYELLQGKVNYGLVKNLANFYASLHNATYAHISLKTEFYSKELFKKSKIGCYHEELYRSLADKNIQRQIKETITKSYRNEIALIHGDAQPKNILVKGDKFYILDWEVAHYGDPAYDLGCLMAHYLLSGIINFPLRSHYYTAIELFFREYERKCNFKKIFPKVLLNAFQHFAPILFGRVVGTYKILFINKKTRLCTLKIVGRLLRESPLTLSAFFKIVEEEGKELINNQPFSENEIQNIGSRLF